MMRLSTGFLSLSSAALLLSASPALADDTLPSTSLDAVAQDEGDDKDDEEEDDSGNKEDGLDSLLDDILQEGPKEDSVKEEQEAVKSGDIDDRVGGSTVVLPDKSKARRVIKTIEKKNFMKIGRFEATPHLATVTNDPFLNRYLLGAGFTYHLTEVFAAEIDGAYSPVLGEADWKPLTDQLKDYNAVMPDISPMNFVGSGCFAFSPIYGKVAIFGRRVIAFDIFGVFGMGFAYTRDDLEAIGGEGDDMAEATANDYHATTNFGGGARVELSQNIAVRLEGRSLIYIESVQATTLEMKNNFILQGGVSFFFPGMD